MDTLRAVNLSSILTQQHHHHNHDNSNTALVVTTSANTNSSSNCGNNSSSNNNSKKSSSQTTSTSSSSTTTSSSSVTTSNNSNNINNATNACNNNNNASTTSSSSTPSSGTAAAATLDKDKLTRLVTTFAELSKHEKILFLINIREYTRDEKAAVVVGGCHGAVLNGSASSATSTTITSLSSSSSPSPTIKVEPLLPGEERNGGGDGTTPPPLLLRSSTPSNNNSTTTTSLSSSSTTTPQSLRLSRTSNWLQKTFIQDSQVALPKEEVYSLYKHEFIRLNEKPISTADFGKLMRQVFPDVKARRLGQRGQSKYCYANIRKRSEIEKPALPTPLPQNELITWAKNKFNIDFCEVGQVVAYLKSENTLNTTRKRRASCGGNLLKQRSSSGAGARDGGSNSGERGSGSSKQGAQRSASVSVLELETKEDPLMLYDNESLEIGSYFESSPSATSNWPQLRSLLTDDSNSSSTFTTFGVMAAAAAAAAAAAGGNSSSSHSNSICGSSGSGSSNSKKKRHSSSVQFEFIKPDMTSPAALLHRSQSVPVSSFIPNTTLDELQSTSTSSIFESELLISSGVVIGGSGSGGGIHETNNNPLFSSAVTGCTTTTNKNQPVSSTSSCSSSCSVMFDSIGDLGSSGGNGSSSVIGVDVNIGSDSLCGVSGGLAGLTGGILNNSSSSSSGSGVGGILSGLGGGISGGGGDISTSNNLLLTNGSSSSSHVGSDVFFDSVFDLMMSDCQN